MRVRRLQFVLAASVLINIVFLAIFIGASVDKPAKAKIRSAKIVESAERFKGLQISFATPMLTSGESCPVKVIPDVKAVHKWAGPKNLTIAFLEPVPPGKCLVVLPQNQQKDINGKKLQAKPVEIITPPLELLLVDGPTQTEAGDLHILVSFSGSVRPDDLQKNLTIADQQGVAIPYQLVTTEAAPNHTLVFQAPDKDTRKIQCLIKKGLLAEGGEIPMAADCLKTLPLPDELSIGLLKGGQSDQELFIDFKLSSETSVSRLKKAISIDPSVSFSVRRRWAGNYRLTGDFAPRTFYRITFAKGLVSLNGHVLHETSTRTVVTPALPQSFTFLTHGPVLPFTPDASLPFQACNISSLELTAWRLYPNNIQAFFRDGENNPRSYAYPVGDFKQEVPMTRDRTHVVTIPLCHVIKDFKPGIYVLETRNPDAWWRQERRTVVLTDIGLVAHTSAKAGTFWSRSLHDNRPIEGCLVQVVSARNQEMGRGVTGNDGSVHISFDPTLENERPYLVIAARAGDVSVMKLPETSHGLQAFCVSGNPMGTEGYLH